MQHVATSLWSPTTSDWTHILLAVAVGTAISWVARLVLGAPYSAIPVCIILAVRSARAAHIQSQAIQQSKHMHSKEVQALREALNRQQAEHLAVIRKMKLEQNQVLLKCHELQQSLRT